MKKIVGIIAAAAMAASVFAVDLASMVQLDGDLMGYDSAYHEKQKYYSASHSSDKESYKNI